MERDVYTCDICDTVPPDKNHYNPYICTACGKKVCNIHSGMCPHPNLAKKTEKKESTLDMLLEVQKDARKKIPRQLDEDGNPIPF